LIKTLIKEIFIVLNVILYLYFYDYLNLYELEFV